MASVPAPPPGGRPSPSSIVPPPPGGRPAAPAPAAAGKPAAKKSKKDKGGADGEKKKGKGRLFVIIAVVVALLGFMEKGKFIKPHYSAKNPPAASSTVFDVGNVTTNLSDGSLAQIDVEVQLTKAGSSKTLTSNTNLLVGATVQVVGAETYGQMVPAPGRAALAAHLLADYNKLLGQVDGGNQIYKVMFSSYIVQPPGG